MNIDKLYKQLENCPGYEHRGGYNLILEPICVHCNFSWWAHKIRPPKSPPLKGEE